MRSKSCKSWEMNKTAVPVSACISESKSKTESCTEVSKAVVGSSAMRRSGLAQIAPAIMTRCFCPPESWCGYAEKMRCGSGSFTRSKSRRTSALISSFFKSECRCKTSAICAPQVITGLSEVMGS